MPRHDREMDYDDLVDQFIVNDTKNEPLSKMKMEAENENIKNINESIAIHMRQLIQSRELARQTVKLEKVKERNRQFEVKRREFVKECGVEGFFVNCERRRKLLLLKAPPLSSEATETENINIIEDDLMEIAATEETGTRTRTGTVINRPNTTEMIPCRLELDY